MTYDFKINEWNTTFVICKHSKPDFFYISVIFMNNRTAINPIWNQYIANNRINDFSFQNHWQKPINPA